MCLANSLLACYSLRNSTYIDIACIHEADAPSPLYVTILRFVKGNLLATLLRIIPLEE